MRDFWEVVKEVMEELDDLLRQPFMDDDYKPEVKPEPVVDTVEGKNSDQG